MIIESAKNSRSKVVNLLGEHGLPVADLPKVLDNFLIARDNNLLLGVAGIEIYGRYALLRSLAVDGAARGKGIAAELLRSLESLASENKVEIIYLLTETAPDYFRKKGYRQINRSDVPVEVQASSEFSHVCPQSAIVMSKKLSQ